MAVSANPNDAVSAPVYSRREQVGWYYYDWANSAFSTTVISVFLGPYLTAITQAAADANGFVYPLGAWLPISAESFFPYLVSLSVVMQVFFLPILGAIADYTRLKKQMLGVFAYVGAFATMGMYFLQGSNYILGGVLFLIANLSFGAAMVFYNAYLPDIAPPDDRDKVSSQGWALEFMAEFLYGGVTCIYLGASGADIHFHDTYFVVAHFHYTFFPIAIIAVMSGVTFWFPKMFGRFMNEFWGKVHFWGTIIPFNCIFIPLFVLGAAGEHRRIFDYKNFPHLGEQWMQDMRIFATVSLLVMLAFQVVFLINFIVSMFAGKKADKNPWKANTLEWSADSPPPHGNWPELPTCYRGPYEYSVPGRAEDFWPQNEKA